MKKWFVRGIVITLSGLAGWGLTATVGVSQMEPPARDDCLTRQPEPPPDSDHCWREVRALGPLILWVSEGSFAGSDEDPNRPPAMGWSKSEIRLWIGVKMITVHRFPETVL